MKRIIYTLALLLTTFCGFGQGILRLDDKGLGVPLFATNPAITAADKGKVIFNTTLNKFFFCNGTAWIDPTLTNWTYPTSTLISTSSWVGIGTSPQFPLDVQAAATIPAVRVKTTSGSSVIDIDAKNGEAALRFYDDGVGQWLLRNLATTNDFELYKLGPGAGQRLVVQNGTGNVGIGISTPSQKLDVNGNAVISGNLIVNNGKGIVQSANADQLKVHRTEYSVTANLGAHARSGEFIMSFPAGLFTEAPTVTIGDETVTAYTAGEAYRALVKVYDCTTTSCKARLINTSPNAINYSFTYKVILIGK